jgi:hypothetical protein
MEAPLTDPHRRGGTCPIAQQATIRVPGLKVALPLSADALPRDLVPMDGPAGEPALEIVLGEGALTAVAKVNGKNFRRMLKMIAEQGPGNVVVDLQGTLRPPSAPGEAFVLEGAGFQVTVKTPRPAEPPPLSG